MSSVGAATAAQVGRGNRVDAKGDSEYQVILPQLPTGRIVSNTVFLHGDVKARPFRVEDFRDMLARVGMLPDVIALGAYQINHVWAVTFKSAEATKKMLAAGEQEVKGRRCLVIDPQDHQVRLKLHWLLHGVEDEDVRAALANFGKVIEITKERWRVQGVLDKGSTTRVVTLKLKSGVTLEDLPHQIRVAGELALLVAPGRPMQCLRCQGTGHVRRDCKVPRCSRCRRFGHSEAQCVRTYAAVTGPVQREELDEHLMDVVEAEAAAEGTGHQSTAEETTSTTDFSQSSEPRTQEEAAPASQPPRGDAEQPAAAASQPATGDAEQPAAAASQPATGDAERPAAAASQPPTGDAEHQPADTLGGTGGTVKRSLDKSGEGSGHETTTSSEEPPLKTNQGRRLLSKPRTNVHRGRGPP
ncbi:uncharacterized protein LOC144174979 [Haemaphysalis longicornis]